jgi:hypothetical protein
MKKKKLNRKEKSMTRPSTAKTVPTGILRQFIKAVDDAKAVVPMGRPLTLRQFIKAVDDAKAVVPIFRSRVTDKAPVLKRCLNKGDLLIFKPDTEAFYRLAKGRGEMELLDGESHDLAPTEIEFVEYRQVKLDNWNSL